jgi:hypothetical protein
VVIYLSRDIENMLKAIIAHRSFQRILVISFVVLSLFSFACWSINAFLQSLENKLSPRESALRQTQELLSFIETHPKGPVPNSLFGNSDCWAFLQKNMTSNANQYKLIVTNEYDSKNDPMAVHENTEVWLIIDFANGQRAEMYYWQGGLAECREIK